MVMAKILIVDDDPEIGFILKKLLERKGHEAVTSLNGNEALKCLELIRFDVVITDLIMPDMDGIEAAIRIRRFLPDCKILLFSGQAATADLLEKARTRGYEFDILAKPVHPQDLLAKLRE